MSQIGGGSGWADPWAANSESSRRWGQVAHDMRSPLLCIAMALEGIELPERNRRVVESALSQLHGLAKRFGSTAEGRARPDPGGPVEEILREVFQMKRVEYASRAGVRWEWVAAQGAVIGSPRLPRAECMALVSNLVNNAVEALPTGGGVVRLRLLASSGGYGGGFEIFNSGPPIPGWVRSRLEQGPCTYGKPGGKGLGLSHARWCAQACGARFEIRGISGQGTSIVFQWPASPLL